MALEDVVRSAVGRLYEDPELPAADPLIRDVVARLRRKRTRVVDAYGLNGSRDFAAEIGNNPSFLRRDVQYFHTALAGGEFRLCMWTEDGQVVKRVRTNRSLIFANPFLRERLTAKGTPWKVIVQSWDRPESVTRSQNKHLYVNRNRGYSYYNPDHSRNIVEIDRALFRLGIGLVRGLDGLWLFAKSRSLVGTARPGGETYYIRADVQRTRRGRRQNGKMNGYKSVVHSHPISEADIERLYPRVSGDLISRLGNNEMR